MESNENKKFVSWEIFKWVVSIVFIILGVVFTLQGILTAKVESVSAEEQAHISVDAQYQEKVDHMEKAIDAIASKLNVVIP